MPSRTSIAPKGAMRPVGEPGRLALRFSHMSRASATNTGSGQPASATMYGAGWGMLLLRGEVEKPFGDVPVEGDEDTDAAAAATAASDACAAAAAADACRCGLDDADALPDDDEPPLPPLVGPGIGLAPGCAWGGGPCVNAVRRGDVIGGMRWVGRLAGEPKAGMGRGGYCVAPRRGVAAAGVGGSVAGWCCGRARCWYRTLLAAAADNDV